MIADSRVADLLDYLRPCDRLVVNDTKVIPAGLKGARHRGQSVSSTVPQVKVTVNLDRKLNDKKWVALARPMRRLKIGDQIVFSPTLNCNIERISGRYCEVSFNLKGTCFLSELDLIGFTPLPPYISSVRKGDESDKDDYQTVFAKRVGAVAAPTASLHFDDRMLGRIRRKGVDISTITLHVGSGTFLPIAEADITNHEMHGEWGQVSAQTVSEIKETQSRNGRIIPVGTTSLRILETAARNGELKAWSGLTDLYIQPGFKFRVADALMTNFHLPRSSLLVLVSAFVGHDSMRLIYQHALSHGYRFLSYGDSSLLFRNPTEEVCG